MIAMMYARWWPVTMCLLAACDAPASWRFVFVLER
jgi:hypothetical protein